MPLHVSSTCAHRQEVKIVLYSLWYHLTCRWPSGAQVERGESFLMSLFHASTCFEHHVLIVRGAKLYYTASGIIIPIGGRPVHGLFTGRPPIGVMIPEAV